MSDHFWKFAKAYCAVVSVPLGTVIVWAISHYWTVPPEIEQAIKMLVTGVSVATVPNSEVGK